MTVQAVVDPVEGHSRLVDRPKNFCHAGACVTQDDTHLGDTHLVDTQVRVSPTLVTELRMLSCFS